MTDINTVTTPSGCLLLIDSQVADYQDIINAKQPGIQHLVFNVDDTNSGASNPFEYIQTRIAELGVSAYTCVGLVQHNMRMPRYSMFGQGAYDVTTQAPAAPDAIIAGVETADPTLQTWSGVSGFIAALKTTYGIQNFDMMACALYSDPNWKYIIDALTVQTGVTIRASTDDTGAAGLGGDWFLESHTGVNLKGVYFTEAIENYRGVLYAGSYNWYLLGSRRRPIKSYAVGGLQLWGSATGGGTNNTGVGLTSGIVGISTGTSNCAALKTNGSVVCWGATGIDADYTTATGTNTVVPTASLTADVIDVISNDLASAALKSDGSVIIWGRIGLGGTNNTSVNISSGVVNVYPSSIGGAFAALKNDGSVVCWGHSDRGGSTTAPVNAASSLTSGIVAVYGSGSGFAAINISGGVVTWGYVDTGGNSSYVSGSLTSGVVAIYAMKDAYAALKNNGSLVIWGAANYGGTSPGTPVSSGVIHVYPKNGSAIALKTDGSIVGWGQSEYLGTTPTLTNVVTICSNYYASAALKSDGSVVVWGNSIYGGEARVATGSTTYTNMVGSLSSGVIALYSTIYAFAALKSDGSVVTWGKDQYGADSSTVADSLTSGVVSIRAAQNAFAALKSNGSVIMWGTNGSGGNNNTSASLSNGVADIYNTDSAFAALKPVSTSSYDLSGSYYSDIDRLNILCSRDYRRAANLVTLNSNVFTLSATRSLQIFNRSMPTSKPLTMIVPNYQTPWYTFNSSITLPTSIVGSNSMLITSEIGERVDISGVGTYVNYGTYVYKVESNGTYTKTTSLTINSVSYDLYGGDGVYSSGIALYNPISITPTLTNFSISSKTYGIDTSFNLVDPSSNSPGAYTFTSGNTQVATISGRAVTIIGPGTSVITASQPRAGDYISASTTASLVVAFGNLTSVSGITGSAFIIPTPLSNVLTTYGSTWVKRGADIDGEAAGNNSGFSVSVSADGTVVAIGAYYNDGSGNLRYNSGHVRVYKYNPDKVSAQTNQSQAGFGPIGWDRLGDDIDGEAVSDYSGFSVSISADGTTVAIGAWYNVGANGIESGQVRVYKYNSTKSQPQLTDQTLSTYGPAGWDRLGADIDGEAAYDGSGYSVGLSANGTVVAIGARANDRTSGTTDTGVNCGHVRVYKYNANKTVAVTDQTLSAYGPAGWDRLGADIDGEAVNDFSAWSISISADGTVVAIGAPWNDTNGNDNGHVRVYKYNPTKVSEQTNQSLAGFGPAGWDRLGADIDGEAAGDESGISVSLSADGTVVAIGATYNTGTGTRTGHVRVYKYNANKTVAVTDQSLTTFGPVGWDRLGADIDGEADYDQSGRGISISANGTIVAIGARINTDSAYYAGHVRIYKYNPNKIIDVSNQSLANFGPIGWDRLGLDIDGEAENDNSGSSVSLSADGTVVAIGAINNDGTASNAGHVRVYKIDTSGNYTYTSGNSAIADICGNIVLPKSGGSTTITVTQSASGSYTSKSATVPLTLSSAPTFQTYTIASKTYGNAPFDLTDPSSNSAGAFTFTSSNASVATVSGRTVTIVGAGTATITATQAAAGSYSSATTTASLVVAFGNLTSVSGITGGAFIIPTPLSNVLTTYGSTWVQRGADIDGEAGNDQSGWSVSISADGTVVAIGATNNAGTGFGAGHVRVYKYNASKSIEQMDQSLANFGPVGWNRLGADIDSEAAGDTSGISVSVSADGTVVAIGATVNSGNGSTAGHVRIYAWNNTAWIQRGADIDGEASGDNSGIGVRVSADGTVVAIGANNNTGNGTTAGHVRVYKYNTSKSVAQMDQSLANFGPAGWDRLGMDIDGEAAGDASGRTVSISADGTFVAIGAIGNSGTASRAGHVRIYKYNATKLVAQTNQSLANFGPIGWDRIGVDIDGEAADDESGTSVSLSADGTVVAIGSSRNAGTGPFGGHVRIYAWNNTAWVQRGADIDGEVAGDESGRSVSISTDGTVVAIGARFNAGTAANAGHVRVYKYNPNKIIDVSNQSLANFGPIGWDRLGLDINGEADGDQSGTSVSLSADGTVVAIGATGNDGTASNAGHVRVYKIDSSGNYTYTIGNSDVAEIYGNLVLPKTGGSTTITITQSASGSNTSNSSTVPLTLLYAPTFQTYTIAAKTYGNAPFDLTDPSSNSAGAFTFTSSNTQVATISGRTVTIVGAGTTTITATQAASGDYATGSTAASLVVSAISPTFGTFTVPTKNFRDASFNLTAPTTDSSGAFAYSIDASGAGVATVTSGGRVTVVGAGSATITATQDACGNFTTRAVTGVLVVSPIAPTIGTFTVPTKNFRDASFNLTAPTTDSSGVFTYSSDASGVATVTSGGVVTVVGAGSATISAIQDACGNFTTRTVTGVLVVSPIAPTFGTFTVPGKLFGDASFNLTAPTTDSSGAFTYSIDASEAGVATITSGGRVTVVGAGSATITATQASSGNFTARTVTGVLVVSPIAATYQSISQITKTYSTDVSFSLTSIMTGISNSSGAYSFSSTSNAIDICGGVATILAYTPSAITITATQAASGNYNASGSTTFTLLVNRKTPSYGEFSIPAKTYGDASFSVVSYAPTTDSLSAPFIYTSSDTNVATINSNGTVMTIIGQGYSTITASQEASGNYAANSKTTSFLVNRAAPTFLKAFTIPNKTFGDASFSLLPFTEGLDNTDGTYHFTSSNAGLVSISATDNVTATIHAYTPTPITIYVAIDACGNYAASSTSGTLNVSRAAPTIGTLTAPAKNFRDASFNLTTPTSDSSGAFSYTSNNTGVATVSSDGGVVTIVGAGSATITATQAASGNYTTGSVTASLVVSPIAPTIGALTVPAKNFGDASFNLTAPTTDSSGAFIYTSSDPTVATVTSIGGTITILKVGTTTITATQDASGNFTTGSVSGSLVVSASLSNFTVPAKNYAAAAFDLTDPTSTDTTVGFTFASSNTAVATIGGAGGRTVSIVGVGSSVITATQAATVNRGELNITSTLVVSPITPVITLANITKVYGNSSFRLAPSSTNTDTSGGSVFSFSSNNIAVVSFLDATLVRINGVGTATIDITQAASANFTSASGSVIITVNKGASGFSASTFSVAANKTYGDASFSVGTAPTSSSNGAITYTSSDESIATINNSGIITLVGFGIVNFAASQAESALYTIDTKVSNNLSVARKSVALTRVTPSGSTITKTYGNANFSVSATNESNGAFSFSSSDLSFATVNASSGLVSIVAVGTTTITASRAQTAQYTSTPVSWTLQIDRGTTTLSGLSSITRNVTVAPFTVSASSASNGAVSYALQDPTSTVLTIHPTSGLVTLLSPGSAVIVASQAQGTLYEAPSNITATIEVTAAANTLQGATLTNSTSFANVNLNGASLANTNITNTNFSSANLRNTNLNNSTISGANMTSADLSGASLTTTTITNTNFSSANLRNANFTNSTISGATMTSADLSGATMTGATITGTDFTSATLRLVDLSGASVRNSIFANADLSGSTLTRLDASGASFINANLKGANISNAVFTNANMTNANISGANISNVTFTVPQKLQLLKNMENRAITDIQVSQVLGSVLLPVLSAGSAVRDLPNIASATFKVMIPVSSLVANDTITNTILDIANYTYFYFPIGENEYFQIEGVKYYVSGTTIRNHATNAVVENTTYGVKAIRLIAGSLTIIVNSQNTLPSSSFVVPSMKINTDPSFGVITAPTSNSSAPIVYASTNTSIATINPSTGIITLAGTSGFVYFTASQVATETHESASITSNEMFVNRLIDLTLPGLNQTFSLSTLATLDASSIAVETTDATAMFYVRLSDMTELFQYQTDSFDINDISSGDIKYYVFNRKWPTELRINPSHAMMNKTESAGMLGIGDGFTSDKSLVKHDFVRYIALRLFNTIHGVDLFSNETDLLENMTYLGETVRNNINLILAGISTTSSSETMSYDASGNKYLTNDASGNTNLCRELMRQIAAADPSRLYNNGANNAGLRSVPLRENDSILFKLTITSATGQNTLTGVSVIPSRTYTIKLVLKNTVTSVTNANTAVTDSDMYPNSYAYSTSVVTYAATSDSSGVYNTYLPPAPIPFSRFGYNGWYYKNITTAAGDRVKWIVPANSGISTVGELRYIHINLKVFNKASLPHLVVYTQSGSYRKYTIASPNSLVNGTVYTFYMNFNSYSREPAIIGSTNTALSYSGVNSGSFANNEVITSVAVETESGVAAGSVEFILANIVVGEVVSATSITNEKEYGFSADVPVSYP